VSSFGIDLGRASMDSIPTQHRKASNQRLFTLAQATLCVGEPARTCHLTRANRRPECQRWNLLWSHSWSNSRPSSSSSSRSGRTSHGWCRWLQRSGHLLRRTNSTSPLRAYSVACELHVNFARSHFCLTAKVNCERTTCEAAKYICSEIDMRNCSLIAHRLR
jgi:hypothetical protein